MHAILRDGRTGRTYEGTYAAKTAVTVLPRSDARPWQPPAGSESAARRNAVPGQKIIAGAKRVGWRVENTPGRMQIWKGPSLNHFIVEAKITAISRKIAGDFDLAYESGAIYHERGGLDNSDVREPSSDNWPT